EGGCARFWNVSTGKPIGPPLLHQDSILAVAFSGDGKAALTATAKEVRRWGVPAPLEGEVKRLGRWSQGSTATGRDPAGSGPGRGGRSHRKALAAPPRS